MAHRCHIVLGGPREVLERLREEIKAKSRVEDTVASATLRVVAMSGSAEAARIEE